MISSKAPHGDNWHARMPQPHHWRTLVAEDERLILSPEEFLSRWAIFKQQLARLCFCSPATVSRWLSDCAYRQEPRDEYKFRLGFVDGLWDMKPSK